MTWRATTETGTTYEYDGHLVKITSDGGEYSIKPWLMMSAPQTDDLMVPWAYEGWASGEYKSPWRSRREPVVGERFYVSGRDEWRISTPIVSVEDSP